MKHNNKGKIMCKQLFLSIFLHNIKVPPSPAKRHLGESRNARYSMGYQPNDHAVRVLGTSIPSSHAGMYRANTIISNFCEVFVLKESHR